MKIILILFLTTLSICILQAQDFSGLSAHQKIGGTSYLRYKDGNSMPSFVQFEKGKEVANTDFFNWLFKNLKLSNEVRFQEINVLTDELGMIHRKYQQFWNEIPVREGILIVHEKDGKVMSFNGNLIKNPSPENSAILSSLQAIEYALQHVNAQIYKWQNISEENLLKIERQNPNASYYPNPELWIVVLKNQAPILTYKLDVYAEKPLSRADIFVDAANGNIVFENNRIRHSDTTGTAITKYSASQTIKADLYQSSFRLRESGRGGGIETYNMLTTTTYGSAVDFTDSDNYWNNVNTAKDEVATDAHWGAEMTYDYYKMKFNRNSIDNNGFKLRNYIHYDVNYANAFWDGQRMTFGDGNTSIQPLVALDVVGHEITHGLTENTANLDYQDESGAMNEGFSDIFGACIEKFAKGGTGTWTMGEDLNYIMRSMANPNQYGDPDTYHGTNYYIGTADNGGVHTNSGVLNHWFYRLTMGGSGTNDLGNAFTVNGIGIDSAASIAYRLLTVYLINTSDYADARFYGIQSALDLFGPCSAPVQATTNAFYAVGIGNQYVAGVQADFNAVIKYYCAPPAAVQFTNLSNNASSFIWDFGDGSSSTQINPIHTYNSYGGYIVKLISDGGSCGIDSIIKTDYIQIDSTYPCETNMTQGSSQTFSYCKGLLSDDGGVSNYSDNSNSTVTITVPGAAAIKLNFLSFAYEDGYDFIKVFDGPSVTSALIGSYTGSNLPNGGLITSTYGSITIQQITDQASSEAGFVAEWQCVMPTSLPLADFKNDTLSCSGIISFQDKTTNGAFSWNWNFGDGTSSTLQNPQHTYTQSGYYTVSLQATNAVGTHQISKTNIVHVTLAEIFGVSKSACVPSSLTLEANYNNGNAVWYDSPSSTAIPLDTATNFTTPLLSQTTTYYVENMINHPLYYVGKFNNVGGGGYLNVEHYLVFDVYKDLVLYSVKVYAETAGSRTISLLDNNGATLQTKTFNVLTGLNEVYLGFFIPQGTDYRLSGKNFFRNNANVTFPYTLANYLSIKESSASQNPTGYYYYFYGWRVQEPDCVSPRIPVTAYINNAAPNAEFSYMITNAKVDFTDLTINKGTNTWTFGDGNSIVADNPNHIYSNNGTYTVNLSVDNGCGTSQKSKQITILSMGIENQKSENEISVYPVPAKSNLYVELKGAVKSDYISFYDATGKLLIYKNTDGSNFIDLDVSNLASGLYFIRYGNKQIKVLIQ